MPYPGRPVLNVLPEFIGTASTRQTPDQRERLLTFCAEQYRAGRSIHVLCTCQRAVSDGRVQTSGRSPREHAGALWSLPVRRRPMRDRLDMR